MAVTTVKLSTAQLYSVASGQPIVVRYPHAATQARNDSAYSVTNGRHEAAQSNFTQGASELYFPYFLSGRLVTKAYQVVEQFSEAHSLLTQGSPLSLDTEGKGTFERRFEEYIIGVIIRRCQGNAQLSANLEALLTNDRVNPFVRSLFETTVKDVFSTWRKYAKSIHEILSIKDTVTPFAAPARTAFRTLLSMAHLNEKYFERLGRVIATYEQRTSDIENEYLKRFEKEKMAILDLLNNAMYEHRGVTVSMRTKKGLIPKLLRRGWKDMKEFYDLIGFRVVVLDARTVNAISKAIHEAINMYRVQSERGGVVSILTSNLDPIQNNRGYDATHIDVQRCRPANDTFEPSSEVQVMSAAMYLWGNIQRMLVYKPIGDKNNVIVDLLNTYAAQASRYLRHLEGVLPEGQDGRRPRVPSREFTRKLPASYRQAIDNMEALMNLRSKGKWPVDFDMPN